MGIKLKIKLSLINHINYSKNRDVFRNDISFFTPTNYFKMAIPKKKHWFHKMLFKEYYWISKITSAICFILYLHTNNSTS